MMVISVDFQNSKQFSFDCQHLPKMDSEKIQELQKAQEGVQIALNFLKLMETDAKKDSSSGEKAKIEALELKVQNLTKALAEKDKLIQDLKKPKNKPINPMDTPLHMAATKGHLGSAEALLQNGVIDVNARNQDYQTPLHIAVIAGDFEFVEFLLQNGADLNARDNEKRWTPLHYSVHQGRFEISQILVNKGADVNALSKDRQTPLHFAVNEVQGGKKLQFVELLLQNGKLLFD